MQEKEGDIFPHRKMLPSLPLVVTLSSVIALTVLAFWVALQLEQTNRKKEFERKASKAELSIQRALDQNVQSIESIVALYNASEKVERQEFRQFVQVRLIDNSAIQALEWLPRVTSEQRETYEQAARQDGFPDFQITERNRQGQMVRAGQRPIYFPVYYLEPLQGNETALGFDLASNPARLEALNQSRDQGQAIATAPIDLVQEAPTKKKGVLVFLPIFRRNQPSNSISTRRQNLEGFALSVFLIENLMHGVLDVSHPKGFDFYLFDQSLPEGKQLLYTASSIQEKTFDNLNRLKMNALQQGIYYTTTLDIAERQWLLIAKPNADSITRQSSAYPLVILACGGVLVIGLIAYGNNQHRAKVQLQKAKSSLTQRVQARTAELQHSNQQLTHEMVERKRTAAQMHAITQRFALATDSAKIGVWDFDVVDNQLIWDDRMYELYGIQAEEFGGAYEAWKQGVHPDDLAAADADIQAAIAGEREFHPEFRVLWPDGKIRFIEAHAIVLRDDAGKAQRMIGVNWDITERKQSEEALQQLNEKLETKVQKRTKELAQRAQELENSNAELEQFAYVASHDLQEPLRTISSYTELLAEEYCDHLDEEAHEYVDFIIDGATRMQQLIKDLLAFSRVGTRGKEFAAMSCAVVMKKVLTNLKFAIEERQAVVTYEALPEVVADETQVHQLLQNLISNALKFQGQAPPHIHLSAISQQNEWEFCVQDNGIGIDPEYFAQIFEIFQRLHSRRHYEGTGIGLAICRKIVERHGGRIWVESKPGAGTSFYFTLPRHKEHDNE